MPKNHSSVKRKVALNSGITDVLKWRNNVDHCLEQIKENTRLHCQHRCAERSRLPGLVSTRHSEHTLHGSCCRIAAAARLKVVYLVITEALCADAALNAKCLPHLWQPTHAWIRAAWSVLRPGATPDSSSRLATCQMANFGLYALPLWRCHISIIACCVSIAWRG